MEASKLPFDPFIGPKSSQIRRVPRGPYESGGFRRHILGHKIKPLSKGSSHGAWQEIFPARFDRLFPGFRRFGIFKKSSDENVEMTNIDFVVLEFRKSSDENVEMTNIDFVVL